MEIKISKRDGKWCVEWDAENYRGSLPFQTLKAAKAFAAQLLEAADATIALMGEP